MALPNQFKDHVNNMMEQLKHIHIGRTNLNKSGAKSWRWGESKGVESDHIQIFRNEANKTSFAFAYFFLSEESPYIKVTFKKDEEFVESVYSVEGFREKFKEFVKMLKIMNASKVLSSDTLDNLFVSQFIKAPVVDMAVEVESTAKRINVKVKTLSDKFKKDLALDKKLQAELDHYQKSITTLKKRWKSELKIDDLEKKLKEAKEEIQARIQKEEKEFKLSSKVDQLRSISYRLQAFNKMKDQAINSEVNKLPKKQREEVLKKVK